MTTALKDVANSTRRLSKKDKVQLVELIVKETPLNEMEKSRLIIRVAQELFGPSVDARSASSIARHHHRFMQLLPRRKGQFRSPTVAEKNAPELMAQRKLVETGGRHTTVYEGEINVE